MTLFLILILTVLSYSYVLKCGFVSDDVDYLGGKTVPVSKVWIGSLFHSSIDNLWVRLFKNNSVAWHGLVLGYHLITVTLFYFFAQRFGKDIALVATLLFSIHPCTNQGVAWISGRHYTMMGWLAVLSAWTPFCTVPMFFLANTMQQAQALGVAFIAVFSNFALWKLAFLLLPLTILPFYIREVKKRFEIVKLPDNEKKIQPGRLNMLIKVATYYLFMALIPFRLGFYHTKMFAYHRDFEKFNLKTVLGSFSLLVFFAIGIIYRRELPLLWYGYVWFFIFLLPCMNIVHTNMVFAERYMYAPLLGFALSLAQVIVLIPHHEIVLTAILTLYFVRTASYTLGYEDEIKFFNMNIRNQRDSVEAHINLGDRWLRSGRNDIALSLFQRAIELNPESDIGWYNLGASQYNLGLIDEAKKSWERALEINPKYVNPRFNLLRLESRMKERNNNGWTVIATGDKVNVV